MENGKSRLQQAQDDVKDVTDIMLDNINKADERSGKLGELENRADQLLEKSKAFSKTTTKVKQQRRCAHIKMKVVLACVGAVVVLSIIGIIIWQFTGSYNEPPTPGP